jgi:hypothetical protein
MILEIELAVERRLGDPLIKIIVDDYMTLTDGPAQDSYTFDFNIPDGNHTLKIIHYGKTVDDHVLNDTGAILIDKNVEIKSIIIDDNILKNEMWEGKFYPSYLHDPGPNEPEFITPNLYLGHNGAWHLDFGSPASSWLVDKRKPRLGYIAKVWKTNDEVLVAAKDFFKDLPDV